MRWKCLQCKAWFQKNECKNLYIQYGPNYMTYICIENRHTKNFTNDYLWVVELGIIFPSLYLTAFKKLSTMHSHYFYINQGNRKQQTNL